MVKRLKKILFIVTQSEFGGAQRYVFDLATNLDRESYSVAIAAGSDGGDELLTRLKKNGLQIHRLKYLKRAVNPLFDLLAFFELKNLIAKEKPDIIHLNNTKAGVLGSLASGRVSPLLPPTHTNPSAPPFCFPKQKGGATPGSAKDFPARKIYTVHGWVFNEPLPWWLKKFYLWAEKWTAKFKDTIICVSEYDRQIALKQKIAPAEKLVTIHNGINAQKLEFLSKEEARRQIFENYKLTTNNYQLIGTIANFYPTKGLKYLIEAMRYLTTPCQLVIIGEGQQRRNLELKIMNYGLENSVFLLGAIPDAYKYLKAFDAFVLPSVKEGFPYVILEAMAAGLPIVATNVGGIPEIIEDNVNGFLVSPKNSRALAKKITELLENPELAKKFSEKNLEKIKEFSLENMIEKTEEQY